jgi:triphosphoribosyl-dephospho-CoA synthase
MERHMLAATAGGNAHRGANWALGLPVVVAARSGSDGNAASLGAAAPLARLPDTGMAIFDATCLLHGGGPAAFEAAKAGARAVLKAGGRGMPAGRQLVDRLYADLMAWCASPGGSADLLAVTLFLDRLERLLPAGVPAHFSLDFPS